MPPKKFRRVTNAEVNENLRRCIKTEKLLEEEEERASRTLSGLHIREKLGFPGQRRPTSASEDARSQSVPRSRTNRVSGYVTSTTHERASTPDRRASDATSTKNQPQTTRSEPALHTAHPRRTVTGLHIRDTIRNHSFGLLATPEQDEERQVTKAQVVQARKWKSYKEWSDPEAEKILMDTLAEAIDTNEMGADSLQELHKQAEVMRIVDRRLDRMNNNLNVTDKQIDELTKPFFMPSSRHGGELLNFKMMAKYDVPTPVKEPEDLEFTISVKHGWLWQQRLLRLSNLYLLRFRTCNGALSDRCGYQYIQSIEILKPGYYKITFDVHDAEFLSSSSMEHPDAWTLHSEPKLAQRQIQEICRRAKWYLNHDIQVIFPPGRPEWTFSVKCAQKPANAGNGLPKHLQSAEAAEYVEPVTFDDHLVALSNTLTDMKGVQLATREELKAQDKQLEALRSKLQVTQGRMKEIDQKMEEILY